MCGAALAAGPYRDNVIAMTQTFSGPTVLPDPRTAPELFEGLLTRRVFAFVIDSMIMGAMVMGFSIVGFLAGFLTFGLAWLALIVVVPGSIALYYIVTLGSARRATIGMQMMDIVLTPTRDFRMDGWLALLHAVLFWVISSVSFPLTLLVALFTPRRQLLHDMIVGGLMVRKSPMIRHWQGQRTQF